MIQVKSIAKFVINSCGDLNKTVERAGTKYTLNYMENKYIHKHILNYMEDNKDLKLCDSLF